MNTLLIAGTDPQVGQRSLAQILQAYGAAQNAGIQGSGIQGSAVQNSAVQNFAVPTLISLDAPVDLAQLWQTLEQAPTAPEQAIEERDPTQAERCKTMPLLWRFIVADMGFGDLVAPETTVADLAWDWRLPVVLVVPVRSGCLGQAIAHRALAQQSRCHIKGFVLACPSEEAWQQREEWADPWLVQRMTQTPVLGYLPPDLGSKDATEWVTIAANLQLERFLPLNPEGRLS